MPAARDAGPAQETRAGHRATARQRLSTRELVALLCTLPQFRMPNHLWAQLAAIPYTNVVDGGENRFRTLVDHVGRRVTLIAHVCLL